MKINELLDPSDYRKGDELDSRSPHYKEPVEDEFIEAKCAISYDDVDMNIMANVGSHQVAKRGYPDEFEDSFYLESYTIEKVLVDRHGVDVKKWVSENKPNEKELRQLIADELSDKLRYKQFKGHVLPSKK